MRDLTKKSQMIFFICLSFLKILKKELINQDGYLKKNNINCP